MFLLWVCDGCQSKEPLHNISRNHGRGGLRAKDTEWKSRLLQIPRHLTVRLRRRLQHRRGDKNIVQDNCIRCNLGVIQFAFLSSESCRRVKSACVQAVVGNPDTQGLNVAGNMLSSVAAFASSASAAGLDATLLGCGGISVRRTSGTLMHSAILGKSCGQPEASTPNSCRAMLILLTPSIMSILTFSASVSRWRSSRS